MKYYLKYLLWCIFIAHSLQKDFNFSSSFDVQNWIASRFLYYVVISTAWMAEFSNSSSGKPNNAYTVIGFWRWVFDQAIADLETTGFSSRRELCKYCEIPKKIMRLVPWTEYNCS